MRVLVLAAATLGIIGLAPGQASAMTWAKPLSVASGVSFTAVSCPTSSFCVAADFGGGLVSSTDPTSGSASDWKNTGAISSAGMFTAGQRARSGLDVVPISTHYLEGVSCITASPVQCVAVNDAGDAITTTNADPDQVLDWTSTPVSSPAPPQGLDGVSCPTIALCVVAGHPSTVGTSTSATSNSTADWNVSTSVDTSGNGILHLSCAPSFCVLTDEDGNVVSSATPTNPNSWIATPIDASHTLSSVSCPSASFCVAVNTSGDAFVSTAPGANVAADWPSSPIDTGGAGLVGVSCPSAQMCLAVDGGSTGEVVVGQASAPPTPPTNTSPPTISPAVAKQGQTLKVTHGSWTGAPTTFAEQWEDCNAAGSGCVAISGATGTTYTLRGSDVGHTIRVSELAGGATTAALSAATSVVSALVTIPTAAQIKASLSKVLVPSGKGAKSKSLLKLGSYAFSYTALTGGRLSVSWYYVPKGAHIASGKKKPKPEPVLVASLSARITGAGVVKLKIKLTGPPGYRRTAPHIVRGG